MSPRCGHCGLAWIACLGWADFALWAAACEPALWPAGTFARAYDANRRAAIDGIIDADPVAACVREIMAERSSWTGSAADLLRAGASSYRDAVSRDSAGWPKNPRALAGRLRRAQTFLGHWASTLRSVVRAAPAAGSSGYVGLSKIPSAPSAASAIMQPRPRRPALPRAGDNVRPICRPFDRVDLRHRPPTMLTMLTQARA
jgi:hypothetical protein